MSQSHEKDVQEFLAPLPWWMQRVLWHDYSWLDDPSVAQPDKPAWVKNQDWAIELRPKFEEILKRDRVSWNEYSRRAKGIDKLTAPLFRTAPRGKPGRTPRNELAERIWKLDSDGKSNREIREYGNWN